MEGTFGDLRKYLGHWIGPIFKFQTGVVKNVSSVACEFVVQEEINEICGMSVYMGGGPSLMYAADAIRAFEEFSTT